jgi:hypothetical protein
MAAQSQVPTIPAGLIGFDHHNELNVFHLIGITK